MKQADFTQSVLRFLQAPDNSFLSWFGDPALRTEVDRMLSEDFLEWISGDALEEVNRPIRLAQFMGYGNPRVLGYLGTPQLRKQFSWEVLRNYGLLLADEELWTTVSTLKPSENTKKP